MLASSSKRALISTSAVTCFPFSAARASMRTSGEFVPARYSVILIARTFGSSAARVTKSMTDSKLSYG